MPETQHLVGGRSLSTTGASIPLLAAERWRSTTEIPTPRWAWQRFCSTPPAHKTRRLGTDALVFNDTGGSNTATGYFALTNNTTGGSNTASGWEVLTANITGSTNTAIGNQALQSNLSNSDHVAIGSMAGSGITRVDKISSLVITLACTVYLVRK